MTIASLNAVGPVCAADLAMGARNDVARAASDEDTVTVEVVRPNDPSTVPAADAGHAEPAPERLHIDISV